MLVVLRAHGYDLLAAADLYVEALDLDDVGEHLPQEAPQAFVQAIVDVDRMSKE
jgi:hypothetical protein